MVKAREMRQDPGDELLTKDTVSIDQAGDDYPDEWVLFRITAFDEKHVPSHGHVLAHSPSDDVLCQTLVSLASQSEKMDAQYYIFYEGQLIHSGEEMRRAIMEAAEQGAEGA